MRRQLPGAVACVIHYVNGQYTERSAHNGSLVGRGAAGAGTLYEELAIVPRLSGEQEVRRVDGLVVLDDPSGRRCSPRGMLDLNGREIVVIQTKAMPLNAYVFGRALLSPRLISQSWSPKNIRTVLLCLADQPELSGVISRSFPEVEIRVRPGERSSFPWRRIPGRRWILRWITRRLVPRAGEASRRPDDRRRDCARP